MTQLKLFMVLLGCRPKGRHTEQHDVFFGIGNTLKDLIPDINKFWPDAGEIHIDAWRQVNCVDGHSITVEDRHSDSAIVNNGAKKPGLFFINLGGYKENQFEEFHYKILVVADHLDAAKTTAKKAAFFKHTSLANTAYTRSATAHIDDKFGVDADDLHAVKDILPIHLKKQYSLRILPAVNSTEDPYHLGYFRLKDL